MADDGMLMNFNFDTGPLQSKPVFKGGRWKDRLQAKNSLKRSSSGKGQTHRSLTGPNALATENPRKFEGKAGDEKVVKRQKTSNGDTNTQSSAHGHTNLKPTDGDVISSLFTSNPATTSKPILFEPSHGSESAATPSNAPLPSNLHNFTSLGLSPMLSAHLLDCLSLSAPTAIQKATIPQLLRDDSDAFIQAETGSGKTLAYLLPLIQHILALEPASSAAPPLSRKSGLFALILAPTRELTHQISAVLDKLLQKSPHIVAGSVTGGATKNHEKARLRKGLNILVATPGRLADHLENTEVLDLRKVRWLVLDEGDRLMELGFEEEVKKVMKALGGKREAMEGKMERLRKAGKVWGGAGPEGKVFGGRLPVELKGLPERRTTVLCSATLKMGAQRLGEISLLDAVLIKADSATTAAAAADDNEPTEVLEEGKGNGTETADSAPETQDQEAANGKHMTLTNEAISSTTNPETPSSSSSFQAPAQLQQAYIIAPAKQRLVTLAALLKRTFARRGSSSVKKAIVFVSCADSVDFHFLVFGRKTAAEAEVEAELAAREEEEEEEEEDTESLNGGKPEDLKDDDDEEKANKSAHPKSSHSTPTSTLHKKPIPKNPNVTRNKNMTKTKTKDNLPTLATAPSLTSRPVTIATTTANANPTIHLYKLHGSLTQQLRTTTLTSFRKSTNPSILLCTDVASRGLDLPNIDLVIEYDPPFSGEEHLHRVGRTARAGNEGRAICFLMPGGEEGYVDVLKAGSGSSRVKGEGAEEVLRKGFASPQGQKPAEKRGKESAGAAKWDTLATEWQLDVERWVLENQRVAEMARKAFISHVRAYATHIAKERYMFDVKDLHLGHLAKAFALREKPGNMGRGGGDGGRGRKDKGEKRTRVSIMSNGDTTAAATADVGTERPRRAVHDIEMNAGRDAARKMNAKMREQMAGGASEFNIG